MTIPPMSMPVPNPVVTSNKRKPCPDTQHAMTSLRSALLIWLWWYRQSNVSAISRHESTDLQYITPRSSLIIDSCARLTCSMTALSTAPSLPPTLTNSYRAFFYVVRSRMIGALGSSSIWRKSRSIVFISVAVSIIIGRLNRCSLFSLVKHSLYDESDTAMCASSTKIRRSP